MKTFPEFKKFSLYEDSEPAITSDRTFSKEEEGEIIKNFAKKFIESQQSIPPEFQKIINNHFWDML